MNDIASPYTPPDGELLALCSAYHEILTIVRRYTGPSVSFLLSDESFDDICGRMNVMEKATSLRVAITPASTRLGLEAKAGVALAALDHGIIENRRKTFDEQADPHDILARSLAEDVMRLAGSAEA